MARTGSKEAGKVMVAIIAAGLWGRPAPPHEMIFGSCSTQRAAEAGGSVDGTAAGLPEAGAVALAAGAVRAGARDAGRLRLEGKDYVVQEGDVLHFRFNV